ncbi:bifunctional DNA-formamidopyrimidine glycosylase/DNA-(apurinic or apyrimidinic site) lyase [Candidatus Saccharibacteria bacterium]|nr:bifunctional DNA-formamidopyrimidine glycosylase/DNA-(apurinic or apyrimidinic site) lyase [Candidatus Saccharibacteria bacterium]
MPELPEVETIRRGLLKYIVKKKLTGTEILCAKSFVGEPASGTVLGIRRFGKALVIDLSGGVSLMVHLRMTGQLIWWDFSCEKEKEIVSKSKSAVSDFEVEHIPSFAGGHPSENFVAKLPNKQTRVVLEFERGKLFFNDQRKFGFIKVMPTEKVEEDAFIRKLAKEPWEMTGKELYAQLQRHRKSCVKAVILDQTVVCGLGNIYADEALFAAGIHPETRCGAINREEAERLLLAAREVMDKSIESGGSTMQTYRKADGTKGDYLENFASVFHRQGQPCVRCGMEIVKIKVAGRGTHICPKCQKVKREQNAEENSDSGGGK